MLNFLSSHHSKNHKIAEREVSSGSFIPYKCHWNRNTILTDKEELFQVIKVSGFSFETADDEELDARKQARNMLLKGMSTGSIGLYFHIIRSKQNIYAETAKIDPNIKLKEDFVTFVDKEWQNKSNVSEAYANDLYITVIRKADSKGAAAIGHLYQKLVNKTDKSAWQRSMREAFEELEETVNRIVTGLSNYSAKVLTMVKDDAGCHSEILEFLGKIVNCGEQSKYFYPRNTINNILLNNRIFFGDKSIEIRTASKSKYAGIVSIKEYGSNTSAGMLDSFLKLPFEFILSQSFYFINRQVATESIQMQQNRLINTGDRAITQVVQISEALDMLMSGEIEFGTHHLTVLCVEDSMKTLENALSLAIVSLSNAGMSAVREKINLEAAFWSQLPCNESYIARKAKISTMNLASFASLHNYPIGSRYNNHWGDFVTVFNTTSGTPYYFNFHLRDVGHTLIIGPTGAGKTVLMNFLCAQAQKFRGRMYFFDKDRGAEIFIRAINGSYSYINTSEKCNFNPLQLDDTPGNRTFLLEFLKILVTQQEANITTEDINLLTSAVSGNYKLAQKDRRLRNIAPFLGISSNGNIASRLSMWYGSGSHAHVFDNEIDALDLKKSSVFGFEMADLLRDTVCLAPVLNYLFHRISISLDGTPTMIVLDEAWALIDNPIFAPKIKDWLKVLRKLNAMVIFATQSVEDATKSAISETLVQQTATQIFLPNLKATEVYRTSFMLSEREYQLIKKTDPGSRYFLVKQGNDAVVAKIDLKGMDKVISVLSGKAETVIMLDEIRKQYGDHPDSWLPEFYKRVVKQ